MRWRSEPEVGSAPFRGRCRYQSRSGSVAPSMMAGCVASTGARFFLPVRERLRTKAADSKTSEQQSDAKQSRTRASARGHGPRSYSLCAHSFSSRPCTCARVAGLPAIHVGEPHYCSGLLRSRHLSLSVFSCSVKNLTIRPSTSAPRTLSSSVPRVLTLSNWSMKTRSFEEPPLVVRSS